jgi:hypothetical protein
LSCAAGCRIARGQGMLPPFRGLKGLPDWQPAGSPVSLRFLRPGRLRRVRGPLWGASARQRHAVSIISSPKAKRAASDSLDRISGQPDVLLLEALFQAFLESNKELPVLRCVLRVHKHTGQTIAVEFPLSTPEAEISLGLTGNRAEFLLQFLQGVSDQLMRDRAPSLNCDGSRIS